MSNYFRIENAIFDYGLKPFELAVYMLLCRFKNNQSGSCYPKRDTIGSMCNMSLSAVDNALKTLCRKGLIIKTARFDKGKQGKKNAQRSNMYFVVPLCSVGAGGVQGQPVGRAEKERAGVTNLHRTKLNNNKTICNTTSSNAELVNILANCMLHTMLDRKLAQAIQETVIEMWRAEFIVVDGKQIPNAKVRDKLECIDKEHIELAIQKMREFDGEIKSERKFFMACIYNAVNDLEFAVDRRVRREGWC